MRKLTATQEQVLATVNGDWQSAYTLQASLNTLHALKNRGLIEAQYGPGAHVWPRSCIDWRKKQ